MGFLFYWQNFTIKTKLKNKKRLNCKKIPRVLVARSDKELVKNHQIFTFGF
jgi:hypothetical protein